MSGFIPYLTFLEQMMEKESESTEMGHKSEFEKEQIIKNNNNPFKCTRSTFLLVECFL